MDNGSVFVSIVVTAHNASSHLRFCLDSVVSQKGNDIEIIIVDDGSDDATPIICDQYAQKDIRVRVFHTENRGISAARNTAINRARGEWICFVEGNDALNGDVVGIIRRTAQERYIIVCFDCLPFSRESSLPGYTVNEPQTIAGGSCIACLALDGIYSTPDSPDYINRTIDTAWGKIFRRDFLIKNSLRFNEELHGTQDTAFIFDTMRRLTRIRFIREPVYLRRISSEPLSAHSVKDITDSYTALFDALKKTSSLYPEDMQNRIKQRIQCLETASAAGIIRLICCREDKADNRTDCEKQFTKILSLPWCREAVVNCDPDLLLPADRISYNLIKAGDFTALEKHFIKLDKKEKRKKISDIFSFNHFAVPLGKSKTKADI